MSAGWLGFWVMIVIWCQAAGGSLLAVRVQDFSPAAVSLDDRLQELQRQTVAVERSA